MNRSLAMRVRRRAEHCCEYCRMPQACEEAKFQIEHIIAKKHRGPTTSRNLALACLFCNNHKGPNIAGIDPLSRRLVRLFHPRRDRWDRHFRWKGAILVGRTTVGRASIAVLKMNQLDRIRLRRALMEEGVSFRST